MNDEFSAADWLHWFQNPVTKSFLSGLRGDRQAILEAWGRKSYTGESTDQTLMLNMRGLAQIETIDQILANLEETREAAAEEVRSREGI